MIINKLIEGIVALYIRVSTLNQVDRYSLNTHVERLKDYCSANGIKEFKIYREAGFSAKDTKRPAFEDLIRDIKEGKISSVFVIKLDSYPQGQVGVVGDVQALQFGLVQDVLGQVGQAGGVLVDIGAVSIDRKSVV